MGRKALDKPVNTYVDGRAATKIAKLNEFRKLLLTNPQGLKMSEVTELLDISNNSAHHYRVETGAVEAGTGHGFWTIRPGEEDIELSVLMLNRAVKDGSITQDMIDCAAGILEAARALQRR